MLRRTNFLSPFDADVSPWPAGTTFVLALRLVETSEKVSFAGKSVVFADGSSQSRGDAVECFGERPRCTRACLFAFGLRGHLKGWKRRLFFLCSEVLILF